MDSTEVRVHGRQEQSAYNGHFESTCYHPLLLFNREGDCLAAKLRPGKPAQRLRRTAKTSRTYDPNRDQRDVWLTRRRRRARLSGEGEAQNENSGSNER